MKDPEEKCVNTHQSFSNLAERKDILNISAFPSKEKDQRI